MRMKVLFLALMTGILGCSDGPGIVFPVAGDVAIVSGRVFPALEEAMVYLMGGSAIDSTTLNTQSEMFEFREVPYGTYYLKVTAPGYGTYDIRVLVDEPVVSLQEPIKLSMQPLLINYAYPYDGTVIDSAFLAKDGYVTDTSISMKIDFDERMDTASVINAIEISPVLNNVRCSWMRSLDYLTIEIPREELNGVPELVVTIRDDAADFYGHRFEMDFTLRYPVDSAFDFEPPPEPQPLLIDYHTPRPGDRDVPVATPVMFRFDSVMDKASVENAFRIEPAAEPSFEWEYGSRSYSTLNIIFANGLLFGTRYKVTLAAGWRLVDSGAIMNSYSFDFRTEEIAVKEFFPKNGQTEVLPAFSLRFILNFKPDVDNFKESFSIDPPVDSLRFVYIESEDEVRVSHAPFDTATTYRVTLDSTLRSPGGTTMGRRTGFSFVTTTGPDSWKIRDTLSDTLSWTPTPSRQAVEWPVKNGFSIKFSEQMNIARVESLLVIMPLLSYYVVWTNATTSAPTLEVRPMHYLKSNTTYTIGIDSGSLSAGVRNNKPIGFSFTTQPLRLVGHHPATDQRNVTATTPVTLSFNMPIDKATLADAIQSSPPLNGFSVDSVTSGGEPEVWTYRLSHEPFAAGTNYSIIVDTTVTDPFGINAENGAAIIFSTDE